MAATPSGAGYWLVGADGGVFTFGDAVFAGSAVGRGPDRVVGIAAAGPRAYRLVDERGATFSFGEAAPLAPVQVVEGAVVGIAPAPTSGGPGYWIVSADGRVTSVGHVLDDGRVRPIPTGEVVAVAAPSP